MAKCVCGDPFEADYVYASGSETFDSVPLCAHHLRRVQVGEIPHEQVIQAASAKPAEARRLLNQES